MKNPIVRVDVREDIRLGRQPFSKIMNAANTLRAGQQLLLMAPFEPLPLIDILTIQGFQHTSRQTDFGEWEVLFTRQSDASAQVQGKTHAAHKSGKIRAINSGDIVEVDACGLEPPMPMVKILEAVASLPPGAALRARTDRRPIHLHAQLKERGFAANSEEQADGTFVTHIRPG
jgi:uncharacterized protein (DUF2249 family)